MIKCGIKSAVLVNSSPFNLYPGKFFIPGLRCFVSGLIKGLLSHLSAQVKLRLFQTDVTLNDKVSDKYFVDFDFDLSRSLFIFAYNDEEKVSPILRDRMVKIKTNGYLLQDKIQIAQKHMIERTLKEYNMAKNDIIFSDDIIQYIIQKIDVEEGVRNMKRAINDIVSNINLNRLLSEANYIKLPYTVKNDDVDKYVHNVKNDKIVNMMYL